LEKTVNLKLKDVEFSKSRFKTYFGNIGEMITEAILLKEGFRVCKWRPYATSATSPESILSQGLWRCLNCLYPLKPDEIIEIAGQTLNVTHERPPDYETIIGEFQEFFGDKLIDFKNYVESLGIFSESGKRIYTPDLVVKKGKEIYIVEVKTNSGNIYLKPEKVQGLLSARKFGFIPLIVHINISINASDFSMQELS